MKQREGLKIDRLIFNSSKFNRSELPKRKCKESESLCLTFNFILGQQYYCVYTCDPWACFSTKTKENVCIRVEVNSPRISWGHQHGCRSFVLGTPTCQSWKHYKFLHYKLETIVEHLLVRDNSEIWWLIKWCIFKKLWSLWKKQSQFPKTFRKCWQPKGCTIQFWEITKSNIFHANKMKEE